MKTNWLTGTVIRGMWVAAAAAVAVLGVNAQSSSGGSGQGPVLSAQEMLNQYCVTCHNERLKTADLMLDHLDVEDVGKDARTWEKVVRKVRTGMMPPSGARRPEQPVLDRFASGLEASLDRVAELGPNPGAPELHRLNRTEYANVVRDLLDLPIDATLLLPGDDSSEGFDNIASVLSVSPALMQAYVSSAARISRLAVGDPTTSPERVTYRASGGQNAHLEGLGLGTRGGLVFEHVFPLDAEYEITIGGGGGGGFGQATIGGEEVTELTVNGERIYPVDGQTPRNIRLAMKAGPQTIGAAIISTRKPVGVDDLFSELAVNPGISNVSIFGPFNATGPGDSPSRRRIFVCYPTEASEEGPCARQILKTLATRAFRHPVEDSDVTMETLTGFYESGRDIRGFETGIQYALARILVDPQFIFRFESEPADLPDGAVYRLNDFELASRLSFFLWSSSPDDELLEVASSGRLADPDVLERQVRRMLADPRSRSMVDNFAAQWLLLRQLDTVTSTSDDFDGSLRSSFRRETEMLFETILREDRSIVDLLDADFTFVDERLAKHYGTPDVRGSRFRRIAIEDEARRGLLGHGSILTVTSAPNRTSPVKRGKWILENLLGTPVPSPPPGVETNLDGPAGDAAAPTSMRQRLENHRQNPSCAACHSIMDPIGFALENFDLVGKWREDDGDAPVNARAVLVDGTPLDGPTTLRQALLDRSDAFTMTLTEKLMTFALGRTIEYYDMPAVRKIVREAPDDRFSSLVVGIVKSVPFQMKAKLATNSDTGEAE